MRPRDVGFHQQFDTGKRKRIASLSVVSRAVNKAVYLKTIRWSRERISQDPLPFSRAISLLLRDGRRLSENRASAIFVNGNCGDKLKWRAWDGCWNCHKYAYAPWPNDFFYETSACIFRTYHLRINAANSPARVAELNYFLEDHKVLFVRLIAFRDSNETS